MINPITIFPKYFRHSKTSNGTVDKFHSVRRFARWFRSRVFTWWLHDVFNGLIPRGVPRDTKLLKGGNPWEATLALSWDGVDELELEAFYSPVPVELLCILTLQNR